jgi:hypothetical protein
MKILRAAPCLFFLLVSLTAFAQKPIPELPKAYVDSTYRPPSGKTIRVLNGEDLQAAIDSANPGDAIVLQAGGVFTGNYVLPPKTGDGWIYIESTAADHLSRPGQRTSPSEASSMPKIQTSNALPAITVLPNASNYRLVGLEITPAEGSPRVYQLVSIDYVTSQVGAQLRDFAQKVAPGLVQRDPFPKNIVIDRCYIHGSDTQDVRQGVIVNGIAVAIVDSYISDIHDSTMDSQAILGYRTPGPIKIVNNFLSSTTENIMFGGAGGYKNYYVPSDIEIRRNLLFKPLSWKAAGVTLPPHPKWSVKNSLEFKSAQRVIVSGNVMENNWKSAQVGYSVLLTVRPSQSGDLAVVNDITIENNILTNVDGGFSTLSKDDQCGAKTGYPNCTNPGESKRVRIANNLLLMNPEDNGSRHVGLSMGSEQSDLVLEHNTLVMSDGSPCAGSVMFNGKQGWGWPPKQPFTSNVWILDNVLCRQPSGDWGGQGTEGLTNYMGSTPPLAKRFTGNVMFVTVKDEGHSFPSKNALTIKFAFADLATGNYQLTSPKFNETTDELPAGVDMEALKAAQVGDAATSPHAQPLPSPQTPPSDLTAPATPTQPQQQH